MTQYLSCILLSLSVISTEFWISSLLLELRGPVISTNLVHQLSFSLYKIRGSHYLDVEIHYSFACLSVCLFLSLCVLLTAFSNDPRIAISLHSFFVSFLEELYDEVSALLNETYQKLLAPPEETPSVSLKDLVEIAISLIWD